ncbi:hypothetical protein ACFL1B_05240 [Nanoarchaeota archaeon]
MGLIPTFIKLKFKRSERSQSRKTSMDARRLIPLVAEASASYHSLVEAVEQANGDHIHEHSEKLAEIFEKVSLKLLDILERLAIILNKHMKHLKSINEKLSDVNPPPATFIHEVNELLEKVRHVAVVFMAALANAMDGKPPLKSGVMTEEGSLAKDIFTHSRRLMIKGRKLKGKEKKAEKDAKDSRLDSKAMKKINDDIKALEPLVEEVFKILEMDEFETLALLAKTINHMNEFEEKMKEAQRELLYPEAWFNKVMEKQKITRRGMDAKHKSIEKELAFVESGAIHAEEKVA